MSRSRAHEAASGAHTRNAPSTRKHTGSVASQSGAVPSGASSPRIRSQCPSVSVQAARVGVWVHHISRRGLAGGAVGAARAAYRCARHRSADTVPLHAETAWAAASSGVTPRMYGSAGGSSASGLESDRNNGDTTNTPA